MSEDFFSPIFQTIALIITTRTDLLLIVRVLHPLGFQNIFNETIARCV